MDERASFVQAAISGRPSCGTMTVKRSWPLLFGCTVAASIMYKVFKSPRTRIFDNQRRTDLSRKRRTETSFAFLNRSGNRGSTESRNLVEAWLLRVPLPEHGDLRARFRSGDEQQFTSALQEITIHELLRRLGCRLEFHPRVPGTTKQPDFKVRQPNGSEFILEACTSTEIESGPDGGTRADRIRDFLQSLNLNGHLLGIDELIEGTSDLSQKRLAKHIADGIKAAREGPLEDSILIPPLITRDGWHIALIAFAESRYGPRRSTVMQEAWGRTRTGPSYPLRDSLEKKSGRYGQFVLPYVIAVNSSEVMLTDRDFQDTLFGLPAQFRTPGSPPDSGFWGTAAAPKHTRVSAVLFTKNLCPPTLLMGQVYACLYLNPGATLRYEGVLTKLETFRHENGEVREYPGLPLHRLLRLQLRDSTIWT